jgi:50S ribosomal subunit-associated GTPase HflX
VFNKCDLVTGTLPRVGGRDAEHQTHISALTGEGYEAFAEMLEGMIHAGKSRVTFVIPNAKQGAVNTLYRMATVEDVEYGADAVRVTAVVDAKVRGMLREFDPDAKVQKPDWE